MSNSITVQLKEYKTYLRIKELIENDVKFTIKGRPGPATAYIPLIIKSDDIKPTKYESLYDAARGSGVPIQTLIYAHKNKKPFITKRDGENKFFYIEWLN